MSTECKQALLVCPVPVVPLLPPCSIPRPRPGPRPAFTPPPYTASNKRPVKNSGLATKD